MAATKSKKKKTEDHQKVGSPERRIYQVRERRPLFFGDPAVPTTDKLNNLWAAPGEYVDATHPVLFAIIRSQLHKVRRLKEGEVIERGSIFHKEAESPQVTAQVRAYDRKVGSLAPITAEEMVVGKDGGVAPKLSEDITKDEDEPEEETEEETEDEPEEETDDEDESEEDDKE